MIWPTFCAKNPQMASFVSDNYSQVKGGGAKTVMNCNLFQMIWWPFVSLTDWKCSAPIANIQWKSTCPHCVISWAVKRFIKCIAWIESPQAFCSSPRLKSFIG